MFKAFLLWMYSGVAGYWLIITSVTTTHHHPELYHAGQPFHNAPHLRSKVCSVNLPTYLYVVIRYIEW
jgi:hypothetical protein